MARHKKHKKDDKQQDARDATEAGAGAGKPKMKTKEYEKELFNLHAELVKLQEWVRQEGLRVIVVFEGRDAAGKGGVIKAITERVSPRVFRVVALPTPSEREKTQMYIQRYMAHFPAGGEIVLFDRSWYNRAMVERVFSFCTEKEYYDFMRGVVGFERDLVRQDTILVKLYFSVTKEEQERRFERRKTDPLRQWKLSEVDVQAQDRWDDFTSVKYEMLKRTHTIDAPWTVVRSNDKRLARLNAIKVILNAVPCERHDPSLDFALDGNIIVSGSRELEMMEVERVRSGSFTG
jgi:polyphosphate kinase 2